jgi:hypothetical protein
MIVSVKGKLATAAAKNHYGKGFPSIFGQEDPGHAFGS